MQARCATSWGGCGPTRLVELGLSRRHPRPGGVLERPPAGDRLRAQLPRRRSRLSDDVREAAYRVVQEALSNAVRHGQPARIAVRLCGRGRAGSRSRSRDDGSSEPAAPPARGRLWPDRHARAGRQARRLAQHRAGSAAPAGPSPRACRPAAGAPPQDRGMKLLLVDDHAIIRDGLKRLWRRPSARCWRRRRARGPGDPARESPSTW